MTVSISRKLSSKVDDFHWEENPFSTARFIQKCVSTRQKKSFHSQDSLKTYMKNGFYSLKNTFSLSGMNYSLKNVFPLYKKTASSGKKFFLLKLVSASFNNGFQQQKKTLYKSILFPPNRK